MFFRALIRRAMIFLPVFLPPLLSPQPVNGLVLINPHVHSIGIPAHLQMLVKARGEKIATGFADSGGRFAFPLPPLKDSVVDFFCLGPGLDTLFLQSVPATAINRSLRLLFPCEPDTTASGDVICPRCGKEDQVYPMVYGDPIVIKRHFDTTGKVSYERSPEKPVQPDSVLRVARFYCRRDRINF